MTETVEAGAIPRRHGGSKRSRRAVGAGAAVALVTLLVAVVVATLGLGGRGGGTPVSRRSGPAATATVTRQTLVEAVTLPGELGYGPTTPVTSVAPGTVTWLPEVGATVRRGGQLMRADDHPVVLFYGALPMYRALTAGAIGADVRQFERNLSALGYRDVVVDDTFSTGTAAAVKRWQKSLKVAETGTVERGQVIYTPDAIRVAERLVRIGANATGDILSYTGSTRVVTVTADRTKVAWAAKGAKVELSAGGSSSAGEITGVTDATPTSAGHGDVASAGDGNSAVLVTIAFADQEAFVTTAGTPVSARYILQEHKDVLTVPVNALLALAEGGYGLEVVRDGSARIVAVEVGLFADGRVEISGAGLAAGETVGVPT